MPSSRSDSPFLIAWWIWIGAQVGVIALFANRVPLSANYPEPIEASADIAVLTLQLGLAAMLGSLLLGTWRHRCVAIFTMLPMLFIATLLAGRTVAAMGPLAMVGVAWLIVIGLACGSIGRPVVLLLVLAAPILRYCVLEFGSAHGLPEWAWAIAPLPSLIAVRNGDIQWWVGLLPPILIAAAAFYCKPINCSKRSQAAMPF